MRVEKFNAEKSGLIANVIQDKYLDLTYNSIQKMFRNKDVKINGKRCSKDAAVEVGDEIVFYLKEKQMPSIDVVYQDENIIVVFKPRNLETASDLTIEKTLRSKVCEEFCECFAVHRLDRNTSGLVIFAKNNDSKLELDNCFKNHTIQKFYLALVYGKLFEKQATLLAYLKKDEKKSQVYISDYKQPGYVQIKTKYSVIEEYDNSSLVEIELLTGKTHQIRAHLAHIGHFVVGDEKYGDSKINKLYSKKYQCLTAYKLCFHFEQGDKLFYLNGKIIELSREKIDFLSKK